MVQTDTDMRGLNWAKLVQAPQLRDTLAQKQGTTAPVTPTRLEYYPSFKFLNTLATDITNPALLLLDCLPLVLNNAFLEPRPGKFSSDKFFFVGLFGISIFWFTLALGVIRSSLHIACRHVAGWSAAPASDTDIDTLTLDKVGSKLACVGLVKS